MPQRCRGYWIALGLMLFISLYPCMVARDSQAAASCGSWGSSHPVATDQRIQVTVLEQVLDDCAGALSLMNNTGLLGFFGGYSFELHVSPDSNAKSEWSGTLKNLDFLVPSLGKTIQPMPANPASDAMVLVEGRMTVPSLAVDTGLFLLNVMFSLNPTGDCIVSEEHMVLIAVRLKELLFEASRLALRADFDGVKAEFEAVIEEYVEQTLEIAAELGIECLAVEGLKRLFGSPVIIAKLVAEYVAWIPLFIWDYFKYGGVTAAVSLDYAASAAAEPTPEPNLRQLKFLTISGLVYVDSNRNGVRDDSEQPYTNATVRLGGQSQGLSHRTDTTGADGEYVFETIPEGSYEVSLVVPDGYQITTTNPTTITSKGNETVTVNFGVTQFVSPTPTPAPTQPPAPSPTPEPTSIGEVAYVPGMFQGHADDVWLRTVETGEERQFTSGREPWYRNVQFSSDGRYLMYLHWPVNLNHLYIYDVETGQESRWGGWTRAAGGATHCAGFSPDPEWLYWVTQDPLYDLYEDPATEAAEITIINRSLTNVDQYGATALNPADLLALLGLDSASGAQIRPFGPQQGLQGLGCQVAQSSGGWTYLTLGLNVPTACDIDCKAIPVTFRVRSSGEEIELVSAPIAIPTTDRIPVSLDHLRDRLDLTVEGASLDGALVFVRAGVVLLWDAAGEWHEISPGVSASLSWDGDLLFITSGESQGTPLTTIFSIREWSFRVETIPGTDVAHRRR